MKTLTRSLVTGAALCLLSTAALAGGENNDDGDPWENERLAGPTVFSGAGDATEADPIGREVGILTIGVFLPVK